MKDGAAGTVQHMKLLYRPLGIVFGLLGGMLSKKVFNVVWSKFDDEEAPKATQEEVSWAKVLTAAALQGVVFQTVRAAVNRGGAKGFQHLTGVWPGEKRPDPK
jgi:hypothetical protein